MSLVTYFILWALAIASAMLLCLYVCEVIKRVVLRYDDKIYSNNNYSDGVNVDNERG